MSGDKTVLKIGLPKGSMRNVKRHGYAGQVLFGAGFFPSGYESNRADNDISDINFDNFSYFEGVGVESQRSPELLYEGKIDALIAGDDWIKEFGLRGCPNRKIIDLGFGEVEVVAAISRETEDSLEGNDFFEYMLRESRSPDNPLKCATEYPYLARKHLMSMHAYKSLYGDLPPKMIGTTGEPIGSGTGDEVNEGVVIRHVMQQCEAELTRGYDYIIECTQSGKTFESRDIVAVDKVMDSRAGLFVSEKTANNPLLMDLVDYFSWMLGDGSRREKAYNKDESVIVKANVPKEYLETVEKFIIGNGYCARAPTENDLGGVEGMSAIEIDIQMGMWPMFTYGIWKMNKEHSPNKVMTDIRIVPVLKSLD